MKKQLLALAAFAGSLLLGSAAHAQGDAYSCGTYQAMEELMKKDPSYARQIEEYMKQLPSISSNPALRGTQQATKIIPVVIHIIHDYGSSNISREQVFDAMRFINLDYSKSNSDTSEVIPEFQGIFADAQIEFRLAKIDPNGNCTEGITRTYSELTNSAGENVKSLVRWDPTRYMNVWVVNTIASGAGGYAYLPCVNGNMDGIVIRNAQFGSIGTSGGMGLASRSFSHEAGHHFGLPHTWGGSNTPGVSTNCDIDDGIADTPNTVGVTGQGCNTNFHSCGNLTNVQNIMDYSNCPKMFTEGQKAVMQNSMNLSCRTTYWSAANLQSTGTNDGYTSGICAPKVDFKVSKKLICEGTTVTFTEQAYNGAPDTSWHYNWYFEGGSPATSQARTAQVLYTTPGQYKVQLNVRNTAGSDSLVKEDYITVKSQAGLLSPVIESFERSTFPTNPNDNNKSWTIENQTTNTWVRTTDASIDSAASMQIKFRSITSDRINSLITPNISLSGLTSPVVNFKVAYAVTNSTGTDKLKISYSTDCGQTWNLRYAKGGTTLATISDTVSGTFIPTSSQWRTESFSLPANAQSLSIKFETTSGNNSTLYLDAVNVTSFSATANQLENISLTVFPNPNNGNATVRYLLAKDGQTSIKLLNMVGQEVGSKQITETAGTKEHSLTELSNKLPAGVYYLQLQSGNQLTTQKIVVQ